MLHFFVLLTCYLMAVCEGNEGSLWDESVGQREIVWSVTYARKMLSIWREEKDNRTRYFVTPICVIDVESMTCDQVPFTSPKQFSLTFDVKLWDENVQDIIYNALKEKNFPVIPGSIVPLPMTQIRIKISPNKIIKADRKWKPYTGQGFEQSFRLFTSKMKDCEDLLHLAQNKTKTFLSTFDPNLEFQMIGGSIASRHINITGTTLQSSSFFNNLNNNYSNKATGNVFLQSKDLNKMSQEISHQVIFHEQVTDDYVPSDEENMIIQSLMGEFKKQQANIETMTQEEWDSVFWDEKYARPDVTTEYANQVLDYNASENRYTFDKKKDELWRKEHDRSNSHSDGGSLGAGFGGFSADVSFHHDEGHRDSGAEESHNKSSLSSDEFEKLLAKHNMKTQWKGRQFVPKDVDLFRLNTKNLIATNQILFQRDIITNANSITTIALTVEDKNAKLFTEVSTTTLSTTTTTGIIMIPIKTIGFPCDRNKPHPAGCCYWGQPRGKSQPGYNCETCDIEFKDMYPDKCCWWGDHGLECHLK